MTTYPDKFVMSELISMSADELSDLANALWGDWQRVSNALKVVIQLEEE